MRAGRLLPLLPCLVTVVIAGVLHAVAVTPEPQSDALLYHLLGQSLAGQGEDAQQTAGYALDGMAVRGWTFPAVIAAVYATVGRPVPGAVGWLMGLVVLPATTLLVYLAGARAFTRTVGVVASCLFAVWVPVAYYSLWLMPETLLGLLAAAVVALAAVVVRGGGRLAALALGATVGLLAISHSAWQLLPAPLVIALAVHLRVYDRARARLAAVAAAGALLVLVPLAVATTVAGLPAAGEGGLGYGAGGGWSFWVGSRRTTGYLPVQDDYTVANLAGPGGVVALRDMLRTGALSVDQYLERTILRKAARADAAAQRLTDGDFYRAGLDNLLDDPGGWPTKLEINGNRLFLPTPDLVFYEPAPIRATWFRAPWRTAAYGLVGLMLAGLALVSVRRRDRLVVFVPLVFQTVVFLVGLPEPRYSYPLVGSMTLAAAVAVVAAGQRALKPRRQPSRPACW